MRQDFTEPPCVPATRELDALFGIGPKSRLLAGERRIIGAERHTRVYANAALTGHDKAGTVTGQEPQRVVTDSRAGAEQDHRYGLKGDQIFTRGEVFGSGAGEAQSPILYREIAAAERKQSCAVSMGMRAVSSPRRPLNMGGAHPLQQQHAETGANAAAKQACKCFAANNFEHAGHRDIGTLNAGPSFLIAVIAAGQACSNSLRERVFS